MQENDSRFRLSDLPAADNGSSANQGKRGAGGLDMVGSAGDKACMEKRGGGGPELGFR